MNLMVKIAAGIVLGMGILTVAGMFSSFGLLAGFTQFVNRTLEHALTQHVITRPLPHARASVARRDGNEVTRSDEQAGGEAARERAQKARCMIRKADGTVLYCDPIGPFTPR